MNSGREMGTFLRRTSHGSIAQFKQVSDLMILYGNHLPEPGVVIIHFRDFDVTPSFPLAGIRAGWLFFA